MSMILAALAAAATRPETITYATSPCFGSCPVYTVTVSADGRGTFEGKRFTAVTGVKRFRVTKRQFDAFRRRFGDYRPNGEVRLTPGGLGCGPAATDMPTAEVRWTGGRREPAHLVVYYGCSAADAVAIKQAVRSAPDALPIAAFIGDRKQFQGQR